MCMRHQQYLCRGLHKLGSTLGSKLCSGVDSGGCFSCLMKARRLWAHQDACEPGGPADTAAGRGS